MCLTSFQQWQHSQCTTAVGVILTEDGKCYQHLVGMQTWVVTTQIFCLGFLDGFYQFLRDKLDTVIDASQVFCSIEQQ